MAVSDTAEVGGRVERFMAGWQFPAFVLSLLVLYKLLLLGLLLIPSSNEALGAFAEEFRIWCFGYDPATGRLEMGYVLTMLLEPIVLGAVVLVVWWSPLTAVVHHRPRALWAPIAAALTLVSVAGAAMIGMYRPTAVVDSADKPFPAAALRTHLPAPQFRLTNQDGQPVSLSDFAGRVVMVTASYSTCGHTCPRILAQARSVVGALTADELRDFRVLSVTLDPERDTAEHLAMFARGQTLPTPTYHLLTGAVDTVNGVLDRLSVARSRNPETGVIEHANLFILVDRQGRIAYRFTLGETQERWLKEALHLLLRERA